MSVYRVPALQAALPPRAPWWRLLRASVDGTLSRVIDRRFRHRYGIVRDPGLWARRGLGRRFSDAEIDALLPQALRKGTRSAT